MDIGEHAAQNEARKNPGDDLDVGKLIMTGFFVALGSAAVAGIIELVRTTRRARRARREDEDDVELEEEAA